ncbi:MAG TPA: hypothetical protein DCF45_05045, partial [Gammaproteobacteria bacterium]|nr:hypothetical protein [Gammaproteobacteria bacterium]
MRDSTAIPAIIDVEASGFGPDSYPIEVGLILADGERFCSLILPPEDWTHWNEEAEIIHGVSRSVLQTYGTPMAEVTEKLNSLLSGQTIYSDGWVVDKPWLITLFSRAGMNMNFYLSPLEMILSESQMERWHEVKTEVIDDLEVER